MRLTAVAESLDWLTVDADSQKSHKKLGSLASWFLVVDISFIVYWLVSALHLIPQAWAFKDYTNPIVRAWNWSFLPLDLMISFTGITSVLLARRADRRWMAAALISLTLTFASGLLALSFWALRSEFDISWWTPNLVLMIYPLFYFRRVIHQLTEVSDQ